MWSNAAQRNRNEAETEQSVGKAPCLTLPPPNEAKRSRKRSSDEAELPKSGPSLSEEPVVSLGCGCWRIITMTSHIHLIIHPGQRHSSRVLCFLIITIENGAERSRIANVVAPCGKTKHNGLPTEQNEAVSWTCVCFLPRLPVNKRSKTKHYWIKVYVFYHGLSNPL